VGDDTISCITPGSSVGMKGAFKCTVVGASDGAGEGALEGDWVEIVVALAVGDVVGLNEVAAKGL